MGRAAGKPRKCTSEGGGDTWHVQQTPIPKGGRHRAPRMTPPPPLLVLGVAEWGGSAAALQDGPECAS